MTESIDDVPSRLRAWPDLKSAKIRSILIPSYTLSVGRIKWFHQGYGDGDSRDKKTDDASVQAICLKRLVRG